MRARNVQVLVVAAALALGACDQSSASAPPPTSQPVATASPASTPLTSQSPSQLPTVGAGGWQRIAAIDSAEAAQGFGAILAIGFAGGYLVSDTRDVWFSRDGQSWELIRLELAEGVPLGIASLATDGSRGIVGGDYTPCTLHRWERNPFYDCRSRPASWLTVDGRTWSSSGAWTGPLGAPEKNGSAFAEIWSVPTAGWDAAQLFSGSDESDELEPTGPTIWHSIDGLSWSLLADRLTSLDAACPGWDNESLQVAADQQARRVLAARCDSRPLLAASPDGREYVPIAEFPGSWVGHLLAPAGSGPWLAGGDRRDGDATVWSSTDLEAWSVAVLPVLPRHTRSTLTALARTGDGYVAGGIAATSGAAGSSDVVAEAVTWISTDASDWRLVDVEPGADLNLWRIATGPAGTLGFGTVPVAEDAYQLNVWQLVAPA